MKQSRYPQFHASGGAYAIGLQPATSVPHDKSREFAKGDTEGEAFPLTEGHHRA